MPAPIVCTSSSPFARFTASRKDMLGSTRPESEFYRVTTSAGLLSYPRVSSALDGIGKPWLSRWIAKTEREAFRAAAVEQILSTQLGDGLMVVRADAAAFMRTLSPVLASEQLKERAATFGTRLHGLIEAHLRTGVVPDPSGHEGELLTAFNHWAAWWRESGFTAHRIEERVSCARCGFGGTLDALAHDTEGRLWLLDWKSSKRISAEYGLQASAYAHASTQPVDGAMVVRIPHTPRAKVEVRRFTAAELAEHFAVFKCALALWRWQRQATGQDAGDVPLGH